MSRSAAGKVMAAEQSRGKGVEPEVSVQCSAAPRGEITRAELHELRSQRRSVLSIYSPKPAHHAPMAATCPAEASPADADILLRKAHRALVHHVPDVSPPEELSRLRAVLDAHMFGGDRRASRDAIVEVARQIDRMLAARKDSHGDASQRLVRRPGVSRGRATSAE
jgi:hypothetical protein